MKKRLALISTLSLALTGLGLGLAPGHAAPGKPSPNFHCDGTYRNQTFKNVRVLPGDTCVLIDSTVTGGLLARNPRTVKVLDTEVAHNLMVHGATQDVVIGNQGCLQDPTVGNNIMVTKSHNVVICYMTTKNNIHVTGNDGRITLAHNHAGRNIDVSRNLPFVESPVTHHQRPGAIRVRKNTAGGHIHLFGNAPSRALLGLGTDSPHPVVK